MICTAKALLERKKNYVDKNFKTVDEEATALSSKCKLITAKR